MLNNITFNKVKNKEEIDILYKIEWKYKDFIYKYDDETINFLKENLKNYDSFYLIVKENNNFIAFISTDSKWWEKQSFFIREIIVDEKYRKHKIGKTLMKKCIEYAKSNNAEQVVTQTAFENIPMQKMCEKLGFKKWENPKWNKWITYKLKI